METMSKDTSLCVDRMIIKIILFLSCKELFNEYLDVSNFDDSNIYNVTFFSNSKNYPYEY